MSLYQERATLDTIHRLRVSYVHNTTIDSSYGLYLSSLPLPLTGLPSQEAQTTFPLFNLGWYFSLLLELRFVCKPPMQSIN